MKMLIAILTLLTSIAFAQAEVVYKCVDGTRAFTVQKNTNGTLKGTYKDFSGPLKTYACKQKRAGNNFECTKDDYIVTVRKGASGQMMVDFELIGDFFPDSGYLYALYCEK